MASLYPDGFPSYKPSICSLAFDDSSWSTPSFPLTLFSYNLISETIRIRLFVKDARSHVWIYRYIIPDNSCKGPAS